MSIANLIQQLQPAWALGARCFNQGKYWEAHVHWETRWRELPPAERAWIQALIQAAGVFHLLRIGRRDPAQRLAARSLELMAEARRSQSAPGIHIQGLESVLLPISKGQIPSSFPPAEILNLRAELSSRD